MKENNRRFLLLLMGFISLNVYLFATAPAPLPDKAEGNSRQLPVEIAFAILARENDAARSLYTSAIVGDGQKVKLLYQENWRETGVEAGPLPALFLRGTATYLEKQALPLSLFLGSDYPISSANKFSGRQEEYFTQMKKDKLPKYFFDEDTKRHTAMFPDIASVKTCVSCHNQHPDSPKKDWQQGDMMGATTWTFPKDSVTVEEITEMIAVYRMGARHTYENYLEKVNSFSSTSKPEIGTKWPSNGYFLPTAAAFMDSVNTIASPASFNKLLLYQ